MVDRPQKTKTPKEMGKKAKKEVVSQKEKTEALKKMKSDEAYQFDTLADRALYSAGGGLAEATAKLKAKGMKDGGMVVKDKIVSIDTSPNSGLITVKGFGASRRT